jgi:hypothetical protein
VTPHPSDSSRTVLRNALEPTPECVDISRFGQELTGSEKAHLAECPRCEAEFALWREFEESTPTADEGAAVQWIVSDLRRRQSSSTAKRAFAHNWVAAFLRPSVLAAAASVLLAVGIGYMALEPEPPIARPESRGQVYRSEQIDVVAPVGEVTSPPRELSWSNVDGATRYDVQVLEIDNTVLWQGSSSTAHVTLPSTLVRQFVPGKSVLWEVTARDAAGASLASSGRQRFRVAVSTER